MAYATSNPPRLISQSVGANSNSAGGAGGKLWYYPSTDAATLVRVNGYFTNGFDLGLRVGDVLLHVIPTTGAATIFIVNQSTAALGVDLNDGLGVAATDTD